MLLMKESSCVYLIHADEWLMLCRNKKVNDINASKYIGIGGKKEDDETIEECAIREVKEETGLQVNLLVKAGDLEFIYPENSEFITVFICTDYSGQLQDCDEGTLRFIKKKDILSLNLWEGDRIFLQKMFNQEIFHLTLRYSTDGTLLQATER